MTERIPRFEVPTLAQLAPLKSKDVTDETLEKIRAVLAGEVDPREVSPKAAKWYQDCYNKPDVDGHEMMLCACDDLLGTCGVEALNIEGAAHATDEGIRMCPPFSYCNAGDAYATTLARDHEAGAWVVACWADLAEEYEQENELWGFAVHEECPERCPECHEKSFTLEFFPDSARGPSYSWVCIECNHHAFAAISDDDAVTIGEDDDANTVQVCAIRYDDGSYLFTVRVENAPPHFWGDTYSTPQEAREAWEVKS